MAFLNPQVTKRIDLPDQPNEWVEIRTVLTQGIRQRALSAGMRMSLIAADRVVDLWAYRTQLLKDIIVTWSDPTPVSPEAIEGMPPAIADFIAEQFEAGTQGRSEEEKNSSSDDSKSGPSQTPSNAETSGLVSSVT